MTAAQPQPSPRTALIVGSDAEVSSALESMLQPEGWRVDRARDNADALSQVQSRGFDLIVTGRHTSGREDVDLLRQIRRVRPHTRFIILAGESTPDDVIASMRQHAFSFLSKSFSLESLQNIVQMALEAPAWDDGIEVVSATPAWIRLAVRCDVSTADRLLTFLGEISDLPDDAKRDAGIAFRELLLNAMEYGGHFDPTQWVEISYVRTRRSVACRIKDPGQGFSLDEIKHAAIANPPEDPMAHINLRNEQGMRAGGYGVMLAKNLVDELFYSEKGNEVLLVKYLHA